MRSRHRNTRLSVRTKLDLASITCALERRRLSDQRTPSTSNIPTVTRHYVFSIPLKHLTRFTLRTHETFRSLARPPALPYPPAVHSPAHPPVSMFARNPARRQPRRPTPRDRLRVPLFHLTAASPIVSPQPTNHIAYPHVCQPAHPSIRSPALTSNHPSRQFDHQLNFTKRI